MQLTNRSTINFSINFISKPVKCFGNTQLEADISNCYVSHVILVNDLFVQKDFGYLHFSFGVGATR